MANIIQKKRLANEVKLLNSQPLHYCTSYPDEANPLIWYFIIKGQKGTDYHNGEYIGKIVHSPKYPAEPPDYYMLTPSGRYSIGSKICLTNSSYHKGDWSSTWNILSILIAFYSIWLDDKEGGISHIKDSSINRKRMAKESIEYNKKNNSVIYSKFNLSNIKDDMPVILKKENTIEEKPIIIKDEEKPIIIKDEEKSIIIKDEEKPILIKDELNLIQENINIINKQIKQEEINKLSKDELNLIQENIKKMNNNINIINKQIFQQEEEINKLKKEILLNK